jgi:hypothetical protein
VADRPRELRGLIDFVRRKAPSTVPIVTTRTREELREVDGVPVAFVPASLYSYEVGREVLDAKHLDSILTRMGLRRPRS